MDESEPIVDPVRLTTVRGVLQALRNDLITFQAQLDGPLSDLANRRNEILANVEGYVTQGVDLLSRAAFFAIPQAGWGFVYDFKRRTFLQRDRLRSFRRYLKSGITSKKLNCAPPFSI